MDRKLVARTIATAALATATLAACASAPPSRPATVAQRPAAAATRPRDADPIVARVGCEAIRQSAVRHAAAPQLAVGLASTSSPAERDALTARVQHEALEGLIVDAMVRREARRLRLHVSDDETDRAIAYVAQGQHVSPEEVYRVAATMGVARDDYRALIAGQILRARVARLLTRTPRVTDEQVQRELRQRLDAARAGVSFRIARMHVPLAANASPAATARARARAEQTAQRAREREASVRELAPAAAGSAWVEPAALPGDLADALLAATPGAVVGPIAVPGGLDLARLVERRGTGVPPLDAVREELRRTLDERAVEEGVRTTERRLRARADALQVRYDPSGQCVESAPPAPPAHVPLAGLSFAGNHDVSTEDLRHAVESALGSGAQAVPLDDAGWPAEPVLTALEALLYERGYLESSIEAPTIELAPGQTQVDQVVLQVREGPRYRVGAVRLVELDAQDHEVTPARAATRRTLLQPGDWFVRSRAAQDVTETLAIYRAAGFANAEVVPEVEVHRDAGTADVTFRVRTGSAAGH